MHLKSCHDYFIYLFIFAILMYLNFLKCDIYYVDVHPYFAVSKEEIDFKISWCQTSSNIKLFIIHLSKINLHIKCIYFYFFCLIFEFSFGSNMNLHKRREIWRFSPWKQQLYELVLGQGPLNVFCHSWNTKKRILGCTKSLIM